MCKAVAEVVVGVTEVMVMVEGEIPMALAAAATTACLIFVCKVVVAGLLPEANAMVCVTVNMAVCGREGCRVGMPGRGLGR